MSENIQQLDLTVSNFFRSFNNPILSDAAGVLTAVTYGGILWLIVAIIYWRKADRGLALQIAIALVVGTVEMSLLKHLFHRERPTQVHLYEQFMPIHKIFADQYSFPSGHTALAFAWSCVMLEARPGRLGWICMASAAIVGLARIYQGMHWPSDVLAGCACGYIAALISKPLAFKLFPRFALKSAQPGDAERLTATE